MNGTRQATPRPLADPELDQRWLRGDPEAWEEAHSRYRPRLEAAALRIVGNRADAEDVVQRVFAALPHAAYGGRASLWSYLHRASVNGAINLLRARRRRERVDARLRVEGGLGGSAPAPGPEAQVLEGEVLAAVAQALLQVRPQHRRALVLRIHHGLSNTEIAEREGVPLATVGTWLRRGRQELRRALRPVVDEIGR